MEVGRTSTLARALCLGLAISVTVSAASLAFAKPAAVESMAVALRQKGSPLLAGEQSIGYPFTRAAPGVAIYLKEFGGDSAR